MESTIANITTGYTYSDPVIEPALVLRFWRLFPCPAPWEAYETLKAAEWDRLGDYATIVYEDFMKRCDIVVTEDTPITSGVVEASVCNFACRIAIIVICSFFIVFTALAIVCLIHRRRREGCSMTEATKRGRQLTHDIRNFRFKKKKSLPMLPDSSMVNGSRNHYATDECAMMLPDANRSGSTDANQCGSTDACSPDKYGTNDSPLANHRCNCDCSAWLNVNDKSHSFNGSIRSNEKFIVIQGDDIMCGCTCDNSMTRTKQCKCDGKKCKCDMKNCKYNGTKMSKCDAPKYCKHNSTKVCNKCDSSKTRTKQCKCDDSITPCNEPQCIYNSSTISTNCNFNDAKIKTPNDTDHYESINDDVIYTDPELIRKRYTLPPPEAMQRRKHILRLPVIHPLPENIKVPKTPDDDVDNFVAKPFSSSRAVNSDYNLVVYENTKHRFYNPPRSSTHTGLSTIGDGYLSPQESPKHFAPRGFTVNQTQNPQNQADKLQLSSHSDTTAELKSHRFSNNDDLKCENSSQSNSCSVTSLTEDKKPVKPRNYIEKVYYDAIRDTSQLNNNNANTNSQDYVHKRDHSYDNNRSTHIPKPTKVPKSDDRFRDPTLIYAPNKYSTSSLQRQSNIPKPAPRYVKSPQRSDVIYDKAQVETDASLHDYYTQQSYRCNNRSNSLEKLSKTEQRSLSGTPVNHFTPGYYRKQPNSISGSRTNSLEKLAKTESDSHNPEYYPQQQQCYRTNGRTTSLEKLPKTEIDDYYRQQQYYMPKSRTNSFEKLPKTEISSAFVPVNGGSLNPAINRGATLNNSYSVKYGTPLKHSNSVNHRKLDHSNSFTHGKSSVNHNVPINHNQPENYPLNHNEPMNHGAGLHHTYSNHRKPLNHSQSISHVTGLKHSNSLNRGGPLKHSNSLVHTPTQTYQPPVSYVTTINHSSIPLKQNRNTINHDSIDRGPSVSHSVPPHHDTIDRGPSVSYSVPPHHDPSDAHSTPVKVYQHPSGGQVYVQEHSVGTGRRRGTFYASYRGNERDS